ncbi:hypothetical protein [Nocardia sp. NBC_01327]|uniref:hypothetical protein n=1 Tax=Nocardia sp. NBC_01327 TaxID=2903593 RepID=UPI002E0FCFB9|nr:hypothetical protein OG326_41825 [Nocardia sp. NBC_01327]
MSKPTPCAVGFSSAVIGQVNRFSDCLAVSIIFEPGDLPLGTAAVKIIRRMAARTGATSIVLDAHLRPPTSSERACRSVDLLTELADALDLLAELADRLTQSGEHVQLVPFGWHTTLRADVLEGNPGQSDVHLYAGGPSAGGNVVAKLDTPAAQRFRRIPALADTRTSA